jgi:predicted Rdx family selenoprotein
MNFESETKLLFNLKTNVANVRLVVFEISPFKTFIATQCGKLCLIQWRIQEFFETIKVTIKNMALCSGDCSEGKLVVDCNGFWKQRMNNLNTKLKLFKFTNNIEKIIEVTEQVTESSSRFESEVMTDIRNDFWFQVIKLGIISYPGDEVGNNFLSRWWSWE